MTIWPSYVFFVFLDAVSYSCSHGLNQGNMMEFLLIKAFDLLNSLWYIQTCEMTHYHQ